MHFLRVSKIIVITHNKQELENNPLYVTITPGITLQPYIFDINHIYSYQGYDPFSHYITRYMIDKFNDDVRIYSTTPLKSLINMCSCTLQKTNFSFKNITDIPYDIIDFIKQPIKLPHINLNLNGSITLMHKDNPETQFTFRLDDTHISALSYKSNKQDICIFYQFNYKQGINFPYFGTYIHGKFC